MTNSLDGGDCYEAAGIVLMRSMWFPDEEATLVHGYPTLQRPPWKKFGHAWTEYRDANGDWLVKDTSNGRFVEWSRDVYYQIGKIEAEECFRYSYTDLRKWVTETGHWGPWEDRHEVDYLVGRSSDSTSGTSPSRV